VSRILVNQEVEIESLRSTLRRSQQFRLNQVEIERLEFEVHRHKIIQEQENVRFLMRRRDRAIALERAEHRVRREIFRQPKDRHHKKKE
jgi:hypothetical protein